MTDPTLAPAAEKTVSGLLQHMPQGVFWVVIGFLISKLLGIVAFFSRKNRESIEQKLVRLFTWRDQIDQEFRDHKTFSANHYATKHELERLEDKNSREHGEIKELLSASHREIKGALEDMKGTLIQRAKERGMRDV